MSQLMRLIIRRETDLSELVSAVAAILWAALASHADMAIFDSFPGVEYLPDQVIENGVQLIFAVGGMIQLVAVLGDVPRARRWCALGAAATWSVVGVCRTIATGHYGPGVVDMALAASQSLAYVKMGKPARQEAE